MVMTGAHENHLFFGTLGICLVLLLEHSVTKWLWAAALAMMGVQLINILGFYGLGRNVVSASVPLMALSALWKSPILRTSAAIIDIGAFLIVMTFFARLVAPTIRRAYVPATVMASALVILYGAAMVERGRLAASPALGDGSENGRQSAPSTQTSRPTQIVSISSLR
jgi:hypothetical protein